MTLATPWNRYQSLTFIAWSIRAAALQSPGGEGRRRQQPVEVAQNGLALVQAEAVMLQHRHPAKGMAGEMLRRAEPAWRYRQQPIGRGFLLQRGQHRATERAAGNGIDDEFGHGLLLVED